MNTNNLGLSSTSTRQLERMIDDAAWISYPMHLIVGIIKTFVYTFLAIACFFFAVGIWMFTAKDNRAAEIKDFAANQSIYRVDTATNAVTVKQAGDQQMDETVVRHRVLGCVRQWRVHQEPEVVRSQLARRKVRRVRLGQHSRFAQRRGFEGGTGRERVSRRQSSTLPSCTCRSWK